VPDLTSRVRKHRASDLRSGENILRSLVGQPLGSKARALNTVAGEAIGASGRPIGNPLDLTGKQVAAWNAQLDNPLSGRIPTRNVYITLTDQRLLAHTATVLGKPKALVAEFALEELKDVRIEDGTNPEVFVTYVDDSVTSLVMLPNQKPDEFAEAWHGLAR
jgi:hypothetical protein